MAAVLIVSFFLSIGLLTPSVCNHDSTLYWACALRTHGFLSYVCVFAGLVLASTSLWRLIGDEEWSHFGQTSRTGSSTYGSHQTSTLS